MYGNGKGFVPDQQVSRSNVVILLGKPSKDDETGQKVIGYCDGTPEYQAVNPAPLLNPAGYMVRRTYIPYLGVNDKMVNVAHVLKCRWQRTLGRSIDINPPDHILQKAVAHCTKAHLNIPVGSKVIAHGDLAFHYRTGQLGNKAKDRQSINYWRGFLGEKNTFITADTREFHKDMKQRFIARLDWHKAGQWLKHQWPKPLNKPWVIGKDTTKSEIWNWFAHVGDRLLYCDTEFIRDTRMLTLFGCAYQDEGGNFQGCQLRWNDPEIKGEIRGAFIGAFRKFIRTGTTGWHNFAADLPVLKEVWNIKFEEYAKLEDSMLAHALVDSELPHDLGFCASIYSQFDKLKHLMGLDFMLYNWGDCVTGLEVLNGCKAEFARDKQLLNVYEEQSLKVARALLYTKERGIRVNAERVNLAIEEVGRYIAHVSEYAEAYAPNVNLNSSQQLKGFFYDLEGLPKQRGKGRKISVDAEAIIKLRKHWCGLYEFDPPDFEDEIWTPEYVDERIEEGEHVLLVCLSAQNFYFDKTLKYLNQMKENKLDPNC